MKQINDKVQNAEVLIEMVWTFFFPLLILVFNQIVIMVRNNLSHFK